MALVRYLQNAAALLVGLSYLLMLTLAVPGVAAAYPDNGGFGAWGETHAWVAFAALVLALAVFVQQGRLRTFEWRSIVLLIFSCATFFVNWSFLATCR